MTVYLLDENVLRELRPGGNAHVLAWHAGWPRSAQTRAASSPAGPLIRGLVTEAATGFRPRRGRCRFTLNIPYAGFPDIFALERQNDRRRETGDVPGRLDAIKTAVPVSIFDMLWANALKRATYDATRALSGRL